VKSYGTYSNSGIPWFPELPSHWKAAPVKRHFRRQKEINAGMICEHRLALTMNGVVPRSIDDLDGLQSNDYEGYQIFEQGDLAFKLIDLQNIKTSRVGLVPERGIMSPAYIRLTATSDMRRRFAFWHFQALYWLQVFNGLGGGVRQTLGPEELLALQMPVPPPPEQSAIANFLDREVGKIDALVEEQRRLIELLKEKRQAVISHAVTKGLDPNARMKPSGVDWLGDIPEHWEVKQLRHFAEILRGKFTHRPRNDPAFYDGAFPFVQTGDITGAGKFVRTYKQTLNERGVEVSKEFPRGTLVMAIAANIGDVAILDFPAYFPDSIVGLVPRSTTQLDFLYFLMQAMKQPMLRTATISTQMNLNVDQIASLIAACPPPEEQRAIAEHLNCRGEELLGLIDEAERAIGLFQERRATLISAAVTGKIDVRDAAGFETVAA
jgi:type I restriction enzyme S subunit